VIRFLLDTNVPSEVTRKTANERVLRWLQEFEKDSFLSAITLGEIRTGVALTTDERKRGALDQWLREGIYGHFADRILPVTASIADRWGSIQAQRRKSGVSITAPDGLIAATALEHGLTLVTRNVRDFAGLGLELINPWEAKYP